MQPLLRFLHDRYRGLVRLLPEVQNVGKQGT